MSRCDENPTTSRTVIAPDEKLNLTFYLDHEGKPFYSAKLGEKPLFYKSQLGFELKGAPNLLDDFIATRFDRDQVDQTWTQPWGEQKEIKNNYRELKIELKEQHGLHRKMNIIFRVYNEGFAFRYEFPEQENLKDFEISNEVTGFAFSGDHTAWSVPAYGDNRYEYLYSSHPLSELTDTVCTPLTLETKSGNYISIHEAALVDYASMSLYHSGNNKFRCDLVPWSDGVKVKTSAPRVTPWRTALVSSTAAGLLNSRMILNLNEPNKLGDVSWIKPTKFVGVWWSLHLGKETWQYSPTHGANTQNVMKYIDFAAKAGIGAVLVEGWNKGWEDWKFSFTKPYPDFDIKKITDYARKKGVQLIGHNETGADVTNYEQQLDSAFNFYQKYGVHYVKTGYVGSRVNGKEWHHGQFMVNHYIHVVQEAAKRHIMLDVHEPIIPTGLRRTYPNLMSGEGARGQEYNAWSEDGGNPPEHTTILPFTRLLAGPMDFTPGIFELTLKNKRKNQVNTTLAKQLALYVVIYSPLQMVPDLPENYQGNPAFQFIHDVPVDWEYSEAINGEIGDYVTVIRKDRNSRDWYLGAITDEDPRKIEIPLGFLAKGRKYTAEMYLDGSGANDNNNPGSIEITQKEVNHRSTLRLDLAPGGGAAIRFTPVR
ncbi:alpha-glucosidase [Prolixibacter sp. SD074]|nr:alpha-glucosidase [Prolixibacter sp. SD074]